MSALFPAPVRPYATFSDADAASAPASAAPDRTPAPRAVPRYPLRVSSRFVPRCPADFGDGGAYPELHVAQFPLEMGHHAVSGSSATMQANGTLALSVDGATGRVNYDAVVTHLHPHKVYTNFTALVEERSTAGPHARPTADEEAAAAVRTRDALHALVQQKQQSARPTGGARPPQYIRYTPHDQSQRATRAESESRAASASESDAGGLQQRIVRIVDVARDPMEPPKFRHTKAVRGPPSPPVPVLHSPPRKLTVADQQSWKIPPCISNWKNAKGFTIALDKRLAADGRGLQHVTVNDQFASLSEALAIAERTARDEVNLRAQVHKKLARQQKEHEESALRALASRARMERAGPRAPEAACDQDDVGQASRGGRGRSVSDEEEGASDGQARRERDRIRRERKKEREREMRMEKLGKKGKLARDEDRDVSEKIALGQLQGGGRAGGSDGMFDARLFNQSQGISAGFGHEDEYSVYSKPMVDRGKASVYRPKDVDGSFDADKEYDELKGGHAKRFKADKQFRGTEAVARGGARDGPVQFSYDDAKAEEDEDADKACAPTAGLDEKARRSPPGSPQQSENKARSPSKSPPRSQPRRRASRPRSRSHSRSLSRSSRGRARSPSSSPRRSRGHPRSPSSLLPRSRGRARSPSSSPRRSRGRPRSPSGLLPRSRGRPRSPSSSPRRSRGRPRSPSGIQPRSRGRPRSSSGSPSRSRGRPRSPSGLLPRSRGRQRSSSGSPPQSRGRGRSPPPLRRMSRDRSAAHGRKRSLSATRGRKRSLSAAHGRKRSLSRSPSISRARSRPRARSRSPSYSRGRSGRRRSPSYSRSRSRGNSRKRRRRSSSKDSDDDPYGLDQFLTDARTGTGNERRSRSRDRRRR